MKALKFSTPSDSRMEIHFDVDGEGALPLGNDSKRAPREQLLNVAIDDCE
jgi:hypothetical protein